MTNNMRVGALNLTESVLVCGYILALVEEALSLLYQSPSEIKGKSMAKPHCLITVTYQFQALLGCGSILAH